MTDRGAGFSLPASTHITSVNLQVADVQPWLEFYGGMVALQVIKKEGYRASLLASCSAPYQLGLWELRTAIAEPSGCAGLYHIAFRLPDRSALAHLFQRILKKNREFILRPTSATSTSKTPN